MRMFTTVLVLFFTSFTGCAGGEVVLPEHVEPTPSGVDLRPPDQGVQLDIGPFELGGHDEIYWCKITRLPNEQPLDIVALEHQGSATLHHFNVFGLAIAPDEDVEGPCDQVWAHTEMALASPLYASQDPEFYGEFPEGVAGELPAAQGVLLEYHAFNPFDEPAMTEARLNAYEADGPVEHYANGVFGGISELEIPAHSERTFSQRCTVDVDMEVFVLGSHFHQLGRRFEIFALDEQGQTGDLLYESTNWRSPLLLQMEPMHVPAGSGFEFRCHYTNETDETVTFGDAATDEMCMFAALYYPDQGFKVCTPLSGD